MHFSVKFAIMRSGNELLVSETRKKKVGGGGGGGVVLDFVSEIKPVCSMVYGVCSLKDR